VYFLQARTLQATDTNKNGTAFDHAVATLGSGQSKRKSMYVYSSTFRLLQNIFSKNPEKTSLTTEKITRMHKMTTHFDEITAALNEQSKLLDKTDSITEKTTVQAESQIEANSSVIYSALTSIGFDLNEPTTTDLSSAINNFNISSSSSMVTSEIFTSQASVLNTANVDLSTTSISTTMTTPTTITIPTSTTTTTIPNFTTTTTIPTSTTTTTTLPTTVQFPLLGAT
jgi:hypothetical protein